MRAPIPVLLVTFSAFASAVVTSRAEQGTSDLADEISDDHYQTFGNKKDKRWLEYSNAALDENVKLESDMRYLISVTGNHTVDTLQEAILKLLREHAVDTKTALQAVSQYQYMSKTSPAPCYTKCCPAGGVYGDLYEFCKK